MAETVKLVFEVENLNNASPATVSRCGIVYVSQRDLGYFQLVKTWAALRKRKDTHIILEILEEYFVKRDLFLQIEKEITEPIMPINNYTTISNIIRILNGMLDAFSATGKVLGADNPKKQKNEYLKVITFAIAWGVGGIFDSDQRKILEYVMREQFLSFPLSKSGKSIYSYTLRFTSDLKAHWEQINPEQWTPQEMDSAEGIKFQ
jgi:hypothetical protein